MNGPFRVAQADVSTPNNGKQPRIVTVTKPYGDTSIIVPLSYDGSIKADLSSIANEKITLVHSGEKLIILFDNHSTVTLEPFFDSTGKPLSDVTVEVSPGRDVTSAEFATLFPVTDDQSVLPAAGNGPGAQSSGANFQAVAVDGLAGGNPLGLLGAEALPGFTINNLLAANPNAFAPTTGFTLSDTSVVHDETAGVQAAPADDQSLPLPFTPPSDAGTLIGWARSPASEIASDSSSIGTAPGGTTTYALTNAAGQVFSGADSGLHASATGNEIFLYTEGNLVVGREGNGTTPNDHGTVAFVLFLDSTQHLDLAQYVAISHGDTTNPNDSADLGSLVHITQTVSTTDGQTVSETSGAGLTIGFLDDGPSISAATSGLPGLTVDESNLTAATNGVDGTAPDLALTHTTASFAGVFASSFGTDGPGKIAYTLSIGAPNTGGGQVDSGLIDSATGQHVLLVLNGDVVEGHVGAGDGPIAFTLSIDPTTGEVTLTDLRAVHELNPADSNEGISLNSGLVTLTATITDGDGDQQSASIDLGTHVTFNDDGPTISVVRGEGEGQESPFPILAVDESFLTTATNPFNGSQTPLNGLSTVSSTDFSGAFKSQSGADSPATIGYALAAHGATDTTGVDSGLIDSATGNKVFLFLQNGEVVGREGADASSAASGSEVFTISVDANGVVTLTDLRAVHESNTSSNDETISLNSVQNLVTLTATITDADGDSQSASIDLGAQISIHDDGPILTIAAPGVANGLDFGNDFTLNNNAWGNGSGVDTTDKAGGWTIEDANAGHKSTDLVGNTGSGDVQLERVGDGYNGMHSSTGGSMVDLDATARDVKISQTITGLTEGQTYDLRFEAGSPSGSAHLEVWFGGERVGDFATFGQMQEFEISLKAGSGDGSNVLEFRETGTPDNEGTYLANVSVGTIVIDETAGQQSDSNEVADGGLFNAITNPGSDHDMAPQFAAGKAPIVSVNANFGADGPATGHATVYSLQTTNGTDSGLETTAGQHIILFNETHNGVDYVVGRYDAQNGTVDGSDPAAFAFTVDPSTGELSLVQYVSLHQPNTASNDEGVFLNTGSLSAVVTITDGDGDTATQSVDVSANIRFDDDGPVALGDTASVGEVYEDGLASGNKEGAADSQPTHITITHDALTSLVNFGADGEGSFAFNAAAEGTDTGLTSNGSAIHYHLDNGVMEGVTADNRVIFTVTANGQGGYDFDLLGNVDHGGSGDSGTVTLNLAAVFTATDGDGDSIVLGGNKGSLNVTIENDVPVITASTNHIVNGNFSDGVWSTPDWWGSSSTNVDGWTISQSPVGPGTVDLERAPSGFLGMTASNGAQMVDMGSSPGNIELSQHFTGLTGTFAIQFEAGAPFPETAKLEVVWNGQVIGTIDPSGPGALTSYNYTVTATGDDTLTFIEIGTGNAPITETWDGHSLQSEDYHGTYLANVALVSTYVVDEDGLPNGNHDLPAPSEGDAPGLATSAIGDLGIHWGADNYDAATDTSTADGFVQDNSGGALTGRNVTFTNMTVGVSGILGDTLTSHGETVHFMLADSGTKLIGYTGSANAMHEVFEVSLSDDGTGAFKFTLKDSLDHAPNGSENDVDLTFNFTATDSDGDSATGTFTVGIDDDVPVISGKAINATVDEDDILTANAQGTSPNDGNQHDGSYTGNPNHEGPGPANVSGTLAGHVDFGADGPGTNAYSFTGNAAQSLVGLGLTSHGEALTYSVDNGTLTATADGHTVFTLVLNATTGAYTFNLYDSLDHLGGNDQNIQVDFGSVIQATDADGDSITLAGQLSIKVTDDAPVISGRAIEATVDEDDISTPFAQGTSPNDGNQHDGSYTGNSHDNQPGAANVSGTLAGHVNFGADGPGATAYSFTSDAETTLSNLHLTSHGQELQYVVSDGAVTAFTSTGVVFVLTVDSTTGAYTFSLYNALDHVQDHDQNTALKSGNGSISDIDFGQVIQATDGDGDHITLDGQLQITVRDDVPVVSVHAGDDSKVVLTTQDADTIGSAHDTATSTANFSGVFSYTSAYGADGPGSMVKTYALDVTGQSSRGHVDSGLNSGGDNIYLYEVNGKIVGSTSQDSSHISDGNTVFTISVDSNGVVTLTQYGPIDHTHSNDPDEIATLGKNLVSLTETVTVTDDDGDHATDHATIDLGGNIAFKDDGPSIEKGEAVKATVDEDDIATSYAQGTSPNDGNGDGSYTGDSHDNKPGPANVSGTLANVVDFGGDGPGSHAFSFANDATTTLSSLNLTSHGHTLSYVINGDTLTAFVDTGSHNGRLDGNEHAVFTLTVDHDSGAYTFSLSDSLDHLGNNGQDIQIDFGKILQATDGDGDHIALDGQLQITVHDDVPTVAVHAGDDSNVVLTTQDADTIGSAHDTATSTANFSGVFSYTSAYGADGPGSTVKTYALDLTHSQGNHVDSGLNSDGHSIYLYEVNGKIVGSTSQDSSHIGDGNTVFAISVDSNGVVTLTQYQSIDHTNSNDPNEIATLGKNLLSLTETVTVTDDDGDHATDHATIDLGGNIAFKDDGPSIEKGEAVKATVDEDDIATSYALGTSPNDGNGDGSYTGDSHDNKPGPANVSGTLANAVDFGGDGPGSHAFSFANDATTTLSSLNLTSHGHTLSYVINGDTLTAFVDTGSHNGRLDGNEHAVFTLTVDHDSGAYTFSLSDSLDHLGNNGQDIQIDFGKILQATDGDGDHIALDGQLQITVHDDVPQAHAVANNTVLDDEAQSLFTPNAGGNGDVNPSVNSISGNAGALFAPGADGVKTVSFTDPTNVMAIYKSNGLGVEETVHYVTSVVNGETVYKAIGDHSGNTVFTLTVDSDGSYSLKVSEPLVQTSNSTTEENLTITVGFQVTDDDGDSSSGSLTFKVNDDTPTVEVDRAEDNRHDVTLATLTMDESIGTSPSDSNAANDDVHGVTQPTLLTSVDPSKAIGILSTPASSDPRATSVADLFDTTVHFGADGAKAAATYTYGFTLKDDHGNAVSNGSNTGVETNLVVTGLAGTSLAGLNDDHRTIYLFKLADGSIVGRVGDDPNGDIALHIVITYPPGSTDPQITVEQYLPIEHGSQDSSDESASLTLHDHDASLGITLTVSAIDGDGDTATDSQTVTLADHDSSFVTIQDDGPTVSIATTSATVVQDETPGVTIADPKASSDVAGSALPSAILSAFEQVAHQGSDSNVPVKDHGAIGYATALVVSVTPDFGTDGAATSKSEVLALAIASGSTDSGLKTTDGHEIYLFQESGLIVGRYDSNNSGHVTSSDDAAFAIAIDQDGNVSIAQYVSLRNPVAGSTDAAHDDAVSPKNILATVTVTDGDGDTATKSVDISSHIQFQDDGPSLTISAASAAVGLDFGNDFQPNDNEWGIGSGVDTTHKAGGWTIADANDGHSTDMVNAGTGTVQLERVGDGYNGMHSSTGGFMVDLDATAHDIKLSQTLTGLVAGQTYDLRFEAGAPSPDSAHLEVWFNGVKVGDFASLGQMQQYEISLVAGSGDNVLEFRETGTPDDHGTYLANVSVGEIIVVDETAGKQPDSSEVDPNGLFSHVVNPGADLDMLPQFAAGKAPIVNVSADFGADGPGHDASVYSLHATSTDSGLQTTNGQHIFLFNETYNGVDYVVGRYESDGVAGVTSSDNAAFAFTVDPHTGVLSLVQYVALHQPDTASNDEGVFLGSGSLSASVTITDGDGDTATQSVDISSSIRFDDDGPTVTKIGDTVSVNEANLPDGTNHGDTQVEVGFLHINWGADDGNSKHIAFAKDADGHVIGPDLTSGGVPLDYVVRSDDSGNEQLIAYRDGAEHTDGNIVFSISLSAPGTGYYAFAQYQGIDHAPGSDLDTLTFNVIATDSDGDSVQTSLTVNVTDDVPTAHSDIGSATEGMSVSATAADGVLANDVAGADGFAAVAIVGVAAGSDTSSPVSGGIDTGIKGEYGTLHLHADGSYTYDATPNAVTADATDTFVYTVSDKDGDLSTTTLTINVKDVTVTTSGQDALVHEAGLPGGSHAGDTSDAFTDVFNGSITSSGGSGGYTYALTSGPEHGTLVLNSDGHYTYMLTDPVTGSPAADNGTNTVNHGDSFGYTVTDAHGNSTTGTIFVDVVDDAPKANDDTWASTVTGPNTVLTGLLGNDVSGADGVSLATGVMVSTQASHGTVTYNEDGSFTYTPANGYNGADSFKYTITDGDGDQSTATVTLNVHTNSIPTAGTESVTLNEDGLSHGNPGGAGDIASTETSYHGTLPADFSTDGAGASAFYFTQTSGAVVDSDGHAVNSGGAALSYFLDAASNTLYGTTDTSNAANAAANAAFKVSLDSATGSYTVTELKPLDHPGHDDPSTPGTTETSFEDNLTIDIPFQVTDSNGDHAATSGTLSITVNDDSPTAVGDTANVTEGQSGKSDLVVMLDVSQSMNGKVDGTGGETRLDLARAALLQLVQTSGVDEVKIVLFAGDDKSTVWMSQQAAIDFINNDANFSGNGLKGVGSGTNYDAALNGAEHAFDTAPSTPDDNRIAYFLSDGAPSSGDAIGQTDETNWINDLAGEKITDSYAIGFGDLTTSNANALEPIAVSAGESTSTHTTAAQDNHVIVIDDSDFSSLGATLAATVPASVSGNVATGTVTSGTGGADHFGADGGRVLSITIDGTTYTWDGAHKITETGVLNGSMDANSISVHTALGGQVDFYFAGGNAHEAGDWSYTAPKDVPGNSQEVFHYVLTDNDGDTAGADLTVNIAAVNDAPVNTVPVAVSVDEDSPLAFTGTNQISIADFDGGSGVETVTLSVLHGTLNLGTTSGLTSVADNGTDHVTLSGTIADINAALNSLSYQGVQNYYGSDTLTITTNDNGNGGSGGAKSDTDQVTITVNPVDDAPTAHITASNPFHATEQVGLTLATGGQALGSIADIDAGANDNMTVTLSVGEGSLNVVAGNSGIDNISNNGTSSVTITGTVAEINHLLGGIDAGSGFAGSITYTDNTDNPSASTTLTLTVNDNSHAGSGGPLTGSDIATINIAATDDAPVAANDTGTAAEKGGVSNGTPGSDATGNVLSNDIDVDSSQLFVSAVQKDSSHHGVVGSALSGDYGTLTLNSDGSYTYVVNNNDSDVQGLNVGGTLKDTFTYTVSDGQQTDTAQITITIDGANDAAVISGTTAGTVVEAGTSGGTPSVSQTLTDTDVDNSDNSWQAVNSPTASDNGYGTFTETSGGKWTYTLDNSDPDVQALTTGEHLTDTFTVHTADGTAQQISITINGANDAPTTDLNGGSNGTGNTVTFTEQTPVHIVPSAVVSDVDSPNLASMTVTLGSHPDGSSESLSLDSNALAAAALAGLTVGAYNASTGALTITGPASQAVYQEILEGLVYNNTSDNPDTHDRTVSIVVNDGSLSSAATTATIHVNAVDDAPSDIVFTGNSGLTATTSNGHTTIGNGLTLFSLGAVDVDDTTGFSYHFGSNNSVNVTIGGSSESFSMGSNSGVTTTSSLSYSTVQTINLTTPTVTDGDGLSHSETVTLQLGLNNANDSINGSAIANDQVIYGFGGNDTLTGGSGDDWIMGGTGADAVSAGAGNDTINLANGDFGNGESIDGGSGADRIVLTNGTTVDFTTGSVVGVETLIGSSSADHVTMSATQWASFSTIDLGADSSGSDTLTVEVSGTVNISAGNTPTVTGVESGSLVGSGSSDTLTITGDQLDAILGTAGTVNFDGGTNDTLNLLSTSADLNALGNGSNSNISGLETISAALATSGVTIDMSGQSEAFTLTGSSHDDVLKGGSGNDRIIGGGGNDTLTGGGGNDAFRLSSPTGGTVEITDFSNDNQHNNLDVIEILGSAFGGLNPTNTPGSLFGSSGNDNFGSTSERFHFNTNTHELLYDSNGSAAGGTQEVLAILDNGHTLAASQVHIV